MDGWMAGWMDGWMDEWMTQCGVTPSSFQGITGVKQHL